MANSLRAKLSKLRHDGHITDAEYKEFIKKLDGHDRELRNKAIDEFANALKKSEHMYKWSCTDTPMEFCMGEHCDNCEKIFAQEIDEIAEQMREKENGI